MTKNILLMCEDAPVLKINFDEGIYDVLNAKLLPYGLRGKRLYEIPDESTLVTREGRTKYTVAINHNYSAVITWLSNRTLSLGRKNAKWLYDLLHLEQVDNEVQKAKIAIICKAVSLLDNYWIMTEGSNVTWNQLNLRHNSLNQVIAQVALHGSSLTLQGELTTPEFTTNGAYAKAWRRHDDDSLWLYKLGANGSAESKIEVMCSNLLDKMNVEHCHYEAGEDEGKYVCMCPCLTSDDVSILSGMEFISYCNVNGLNPDEEMMRIDSQNIYKMWIVDYLFANRDRHSQNWGFYYDPRTMEIFKCHPLFDHNNAFDIEYMQGRNKIYQFRNIPMCDAAKYAIKRVEFYFTEPIVRSDFMTDRQYKEFMYRAKELGIQTLTGYDALISKEAIKLGLNRPLSELKSILPKVELSDDELKSAMSVIKDYERK